MHTSPHHLHPNCNPDVVHRVRSSYSCRVGAQMYLGGAQMYLVYADMARCCDTGDTLCILLCKQGHCIMMGSWLGWLVLVGLTAPHSWQAQSSHLCRPTSVILTVRPPLNWTLLQCTRPDTTKCMYQVLQCIASGNLKWTRRTEWKQLETLLYKCRRS